MSDIQIFDSGQLDGMSNDHALTLALAITQKLLASHQAKLQELEKDQMETAQRLRNIEEKQAHTNRIVNKYVNQGEFGNEYFPHMSNQSVKILWKILGMWNYSSGYDQPYSRYMKTKEPVFTQFEWESNGDVRYQWRIHTERGKELIEKLLKEKGLLNEWHSHKTVEERQKWIKELYGRQQ